MNEGRFVLAVDTSVAPSSVAVGALPGSDPVTRLLPPGERDGDTIVETVHAVLADAGVGVSDLDEVVVGAGPGSFTGVRLAAATAKGLAFGAGLPLRPFSSLAAHAAALAADPPKGLADVPPGRPLHVLFDARGVRLFHAAFVWKGRGLPPEPAADDRFTTLPELVASLDLEAGPVLVGAGAERHAGPLERSGARVVGVARSVARAHGLLLLRERSTDPPLDDPASWVPNYLRDPSAVRERSD